MLKSSICTKFVGFLTFLGGLWMVIEVFAEIKAMSPQLSCRLAGWLGQRVAIG